MSFEFQTKEERDAWPVMRPAFDRLASRDLRVVIEVFDTAARRFDEREATCGFSSEDANRGMGLDENDWVLGEDWGSK